MERLLLIGFVPILGTVFSHKNDECKARLLDVEHDSKSSCFNCSRISRGKSRASSKLVNLEEELWLVVIQSDM